MPIYGKRPEFWSRLPKSNVEAQRSPRSISDLGRLVFLCSGLAFCCNTHQFQPVGAIIETGFLVMDSTSSSHECGPDASCPCVGNSQQTVSIRRARMAWEQGAMIYNVMIEKGARRQAISVGRRIARRFRRVHRWPDARGLEPEQPADAVQRVKPRCGA